MYSKKVKTRYPNATAEFNYAWTIWDIPRNITHGIRFIGDVARSRGLLGLGRTEDEAWKFAHIEIMTREGEKYWQRNLK